MGEPMETADVSRTVPTSGGSVACWAGAGALQRVRRARRRRSARVRLLILPSLLRRPTLRLFGAPVATTATSVSNTLAATSLASLMVSFRDSSRVRPDFCPWYSSKNFSFHASTFFSFSISWRKRTCISWVNSPSASLSFQLWEAWVKNSLLRAELLSRAIPSGPICLSTSGRSCSSCC